MRSIFERTTKMITIHTQRFLYLSLCGCLITKHFKGEYAMNYDAVYRSTPSPPLSNIPVPLY